MRCEVWVPIRTASPVFVSCYSLRVLKSPSVLLVTDGGPSCSLGLHRSFLVGTSRSGGHRVTAGHAECPCSLLGFLWHPSGVRRSVLSLPRRGTSCLPPWPPLMPPQQAIWGSSFQPGRAGSLGSTFADVPGSGAQWSVWLKYRHYCLKVFCFVRQPFFFFFSFFFLLEQTFVVAFVCNRACRRFQVADLSSKSRTDEARRQPRNALPCSLGLKVSVWSAFFLPSRIILYLFYKWCSVFFVLLDRKNRKKHVYLARIGKSKFINF